MRYRLLHEERMPFMFSFNYNTGEVRMEWNQPYPVMLLKSIELPDFVLVNFSVIAIEQVGGWERRNLRNRKQYEIYYYISSRCIRPAGGTN